jgi:hypothetical protein
VDTIHFITVTFFAQNFGCNVVGSATQSTIESKVDKTFNKAYKQ